MSAFRFAARRLFMTGGGIFASAAVATPSPDGLSDGDAKIHVPYVLIGGGTASYYAAISIRARDPDARVLIIGNESESPYNRSILSKEFWWYGDERTANSLTYKSPASNRRRDIRYEADGFYPAIERLLNDDDNEFPNGAVSLLRDSTAVRIDAAGCYVELRNGSRISFDKCLIATGSRPKSVPLLGEKRFADYVTILHNISDFRRLHAVIERKREYPGDRPRRVVIIGGGLLGTELAYSLQRRYGIYSSRSDPVEIYQITEDGGLLADILPPALVAHATRQTEYIGVKVHSCYRIESVDENEDQTLNLTFKTPSGKTLTLDHVGHVIVDAGAEPNADLARDSELPLDSKLGGVKADAHFRVSDTIWAAGDVCAFDDLTLRRRRRLQYIEHAQASGRFAGANMTGAEKTYSHQSGFETIFGPTDHVVGVGEIDANALDTIAYIVQPPSPQHEKGAKDDENAGYLRSVVFYVNKDSDAASGRRVLGILMLNVFSTMATEMARKIITDAKSHTAADFDDLVKLLDVFSERKDKESEEENGKESSLLGSSV